MARLAASRMAATDLASFVTWRAFTPIMARLGTTVGASRVTPAAYQLANAMVLLRDFVVFSDIATETETLARVAASAVMATLGSAAIVGGCDVLVTSYLHFMVAAGDRACDLYHATN